MKDFGRTLVIAFALTISSIAILLVTKQHLSVQQPLPPSPWWEIRSIDTMKYSRDLTREKLNDPSFDATIDMQIGNIAKTGATHVAIATPYDEQFVPMLKRWVAAARKYHLSVWFRGNFSGWEQWFDYPRMTRDSHTKALAAFISNHPDLFAEGDILTPCPECENGGPGDPRQTGDVDGYREFLITEYRTATDAFRKIGKGVTVGFFSMNYDVANLIMDRATTETLGGVVTIDHYVKTPNQLASDARKLADKSGGKIFFGEFGAPIPDINGNMNEEEQARWITDAMASLVNEPEVIGINYWVSVGGSTQLWTEGGRERKAVQALTRIYRPATFKGTVRDQFRNPIANMEIQISGRTYITDAYGRFNAPILDMDNNADFHKDRYADTTVRIIKSDNAQDIVIVKNAPSVMDRILGLFNK